MKPRQILKIACLAVLGATTSVTVALAGWAAEARLSQSGARPPARVAIELPAVEFRILKQSSTASAFVSVFAIRRVGQAMNPQGESGELLSFVSQANLPGWVDPPYELAAEYTQNPPEYNISRSVHSHSFYATGWPWRCLRGDLAIQDMNSAPQPHGLLRGSSFGLGGWVPILPYWPGLLGNTLVFSTLWCLGAAFSMYMRREWRRRRGRCIGCGYDLRGQPTPGCPECGWARPAAASG